MHRADMVRRRRGHDSVKNGPMVRLRRSREHRPPDELTGVADAQENEHHSAGST
jgi:hypothetical protein